jgi:hypothetical protein
MDFLWSCIQTKGGTSNEMCPKASPNFWGYGRPERHSCIPSQTEWSNALTEPWSSICRRWLTNIKGTGTDIYHCSCWRIEQRSTKRHTPHQTSVKILFGHELRLPCDLTFESPARVSKDVTSYVDELQEAMHTIHDLTRSHILVASDRMKTRYDLKANTAGFREGDLVWLLNRQSCSRVGKDRSSS